MRNWRILAVALAVAMTAVPAVWAQQLKYDPVTMPTLPTRTTPQGLPNFPALLSYKYAVTPQAGEWLVCVQTFRGTHAQALAEELAEILNGKEYKLVAYLNDRGRKERLEEQARVQKLRDQYWSAVEDLRKTGSEPIGPLRFRHIGTIPDEFAVLVGKPNRPLKDMDAAHDFLVDHVRKLKPLPDRFCSQATFGDDVSGKNTKSTSVNPFALAMIAHNPSIELKKQQDDPDKADAFLKELNSGESYSVLKCSKAWTLVVKVYQGQVTLQDSKSPSLMSRIGLAKKESDALGMGAVKAHQLADFLRHMKPSFEAHVMHSRQYSIVTVGQYDSADDPKLKAAQKTLAALVIKGTGTNGDGKPDPYKDVVLETLNHQPLPMKIPK